MATAIQVAMINTNRERGGAARIASSMTHDFNASEFAVSARLAHFGDDRQDGAFTGFRRKWQAYAMAAQTRVAGSLNVHDFGVYKRLLETTVGADVVHLHNLHGYYLNIPAFVRALASRPLVWTWHDMWGATGRCGLPEGCDRWQQGCAPCPLKHLYPAAWIDHSASEFAAKFALFEQCERLMIVSPSQWLADVAIERGYPAQQVVVIPNSVDHEVFSPQQQAQARARLNLPVERPIALFIAEDCSAPRKGYVDFAEATAGQPIEAVAVGSPPETPAAHVRHVGRIGQRDLLAAYYAASDTMIIPSYADNFPTTVVEALMSGTAVIGYDVGGIPGQLSDPWSIVVPEGNKLALADAVARIALDVTIYREAREQIAAAARERWSKMAVMAAYYEVYQNLLDAA